MITDFTAPKFYDKKIQDLNSKLLSLGWIATQYPLVQIGISKGETFPECYRNDGSKTVERVYPMGKAISFFMIEGELNSPDEELHFTVPMSLTVWADLTKVYPLKKYNYTTELISDVVTVLKNNSCNDITIQLNNVFDGFSDLQKENNQNVMLPYTAFKLNFNCLLTMC